MKYYLEDSEKVLQNLDSSSSGLTEAEAEKRLLESGKNKLHEGKKQGVVKRFLMQLKDPMIIILIIAAVISGITSILEKEFPSDVIIIVAVVLLNAVLGVVQETKAEKAIDALKAMTKAQSKVMRNGKLTTTDSENLVVGDVIVLEAGDVVPADARIIECITVQVEESALTGESVAVNKTADKLEGTDLSLGDRKNMLYLGSTVVYGRCVAVITGTGMNTELGKIASSLSSVQDDATPLQKKLKELSKILSIGVLLISVFIFVFSLLKVGSITTDVILDTLIIAISLAVAAIPEGLTTVVTIVLSVGVTKMSKRSAVIRKMTAVETLGCAQIICSDKTGTLTQNKMTVVESHTGNESMLATIMAGCNDAILADNNEGKGEATESALITYAFKNGVNKTTLEKENKRLGEVPFESNRKMMTTLNSYGDKVIQLTKGAFDEIIKRCTAYVDKGEIKPLTKEKITEFEILNKNMAQNALRVLAGAYRMHESMVENYKSESLEQNMIYAGVVGMIDPIREQVKVAVQECHSAGIKTIMITGDHKLTAVAIGKQLGIIKDETEALTGVELDKLSDEEFEKVIEKIRVYARVQPEHKVRIVKMWQQKGNVTAMTGDGVNDAPSIKMADIGIGMGITGTDVTKNVADMILADDNFATIVSAVKEGRKIYDNIRKTIQFLLSSNLSEVIAIFVATILGFTVLKPTHLLWINLITDTFPAIGLGIEECEANVMNRPPRPKSEGLFAGGMAFNVLYQGVLVAFLVLISYAVGVYIETGVFAFTAGNANGMTMSFLTMSMAEIFHSLNMRSQLGSIFKSGKPNVILVATMVGVFLLTLAVIYIPFLSALFDLTHINLVEFASAVGIAFMVIPIVEIVKLIQRTAIKNSSIKIKAIKQKTK